MVTPVKSLPISDQNVAPNFNRDVTLQNRIDTYFEETLFNDLSNGNKLDADVYVSCDTCLRTNVNEGAEFSKEVASAKLADVIITSSDKRGVGSDRNVGKSYYFFVETEGIVLRTRCIKKNSLTGEMPINFLITLKSVIFDNTTKSRSKIISPTILVNKENVLLPVILGGCRYKVTCVTEQVGNSDAGHWVVFFFLNDSWYKIDFERVSKVDLKDLPMCPQQIVLERIDVVDQDMQMNGNVIDSDVTPLTLAPATTTTTTPAPAPATTPTQRTISRHVLDSC
jgi:hypothetical protein